MSRAVCPLNLALQKASRVGQNILAGAVEERTDKDHPYPQKFPLWGARETLL